MAENKKIENKAEKKTTAKKAQTKKSIDWNSLSDSVVIIHDKKEKTVGKPTAKILVEKGLAQLK